MGNSLSSKVIISILFRDSNRMRKYFQYSQWFTILSILTAIALGIAILTCDKIEMQLWLNGTHTAVADFFFRYYTCIGEWVPYVFVGLLLFYKAGWASFLLADVAISGLIGQGLKYWFDTDRPYYYFSKFAPDIQLPFVDGVELSQWYSFPSGHTTTFFALFMTLAIVCSEAYHLSTSKLPSTFHFPLSTIFFLLALLGGYSRIYLNQHFAEDILGGIVLAVVTTIILLFLVPKLENTRFWNWNLLQLQRK